MLMLKEFTVFFLIALAWSQPAFFGGVGSDGGLHLHLHLHSDGNAGLKNINSTEPKSRPPTKAQTPTLNLLSQFLSFLLILLQSKIYLSMIIPKS